MPNFLSSILQLKCPKCRQGDLFCNKSSYKYKGFFDMPKKCSECGQDFEIETGFYYGAMYVSYALTIALTVAAADLEDQPALSRVDVRALGKISSLDERSFTLETQGQGTLTFHVDGSTIYESRDGSMTSFEDLQIGMIAMVGGKQLGNGELKAVIVGCMLPRSEGVGLPDQRSAGDPSLAEPHSN